MLTEVKNLQRTEKSTVTLVIDPDIFDPARVSSPASRHACFAAWCCSLARYSGPVLRT